MTLTIDQARALYDGAGDSTHDFDHVLRVYHLAERIGQAEGADMAVLRAAALLHDIARRDQDAGRVPEHAAEGARRARQILAGQPPEFVEAVAHAIETHRFRVDRPPQTLEAKILYDADKLDSIGAVGVARAFAYSAHRGTALVGRPRCRRPYGDEGICRETQPGEGQPVYPVRSRHSRGAPCLYG